MDRFEQARHYLNGLEPKALAANPDIAFKGFLARIGFDYTLASLDRIDRMLAEIRQSSRLDYGSFLSKQPAMNFIVSLNFYLGSTIARLGNFALKWIDHAQARQHMPELPQQMDFDLGCIIGNRIVFPANVINEALFAPQVDRTCGGYARSLIEALSAAGQRLPAPLKRPAPDAAPASMPPLLSQALGRAGFLGAWCLSWAKDGGTIAPLRCQPGADGKPVIVDLGTMASRGFDAVVTDALAGLEHNPEKLPWQALAYDGFINMPTGRRDAVTVEFRLYGGQPPFGLTMALPYRPARDAQAFAHYSPRMIACSANGPVLASLQDAFYRGLYTMNGFDWNAQLIEE